MIKQAIITMMVTRFLNNGGLESLFSVRNSMLNILENVMRPHYGYALCRGGCWVMGQNMFFGSLLFFK